MRKPVSLDVVIARTHPESPAFVTIPASKVARWKLTATTTVDATIDGSPLGRRSLRREDDRTWTVELPRGTLEAIGKSPGRRATLVIAIASAELPAELSRLIAKTPAARARWEQMTDAQRRMLREAVLARKSSEARDRAARKGLLPPAKPAVPPIDALAAGPKEVVVHIVGQRLPGRTCGPYTHVSVGFVEKVGCEPDELVPADVREARWETRIEVRAGDRAPAFRGRAVNGPPHERFLYLTWIGRKGGHPPAMFRRAKLRLDAVPPAVLAAALESGVLTGTLDLTAADGMPVAASVRPPAIVWSVKSS